MKKQCSHPTTHHTHWKFLKKTTADKLLLLCLLALYACRSYCNAPNQVHRNKNLAEQHTQQEHFLGRLENQAGLQTKHCEQPVKQTVTN